MLIVVGQASAVHPYLYAGRVWDSVSTMVFFRARHYEPIIGRFVQPDPLGFVAVDTNLFRFVWNDQSGQVAITQNVNIQKISLQAALKSAGPITPNVNIVAISNKARFTYKLVGYKNLTFRFIPLAILNSAIAIECGKFLYGVLDGLTHVDLEAFLKCAQEVLKRLNLIGKK